MSSFSVASFNTRWGLTVDDRPFDLDRTCAALDADLLAVQEVWQPHDGEPTLAEVADRTRASLHTVALSGSTVTPRPEITADPDRADGTWGIALLSRLPVITTRVLDLGRLVERWDVATRYAITAEVLVDDTPVVVAAIHLSFALPNALAQLRRLDGALPRHRPTVIVGDCNLWGPAARAVLRDRRRAVVGRTWPAHRPHSQLDHIFVSPDIAVRHGEVRPPAGSDHRPIRAELALARRAT